MGASMANPLEKRCCGARLLRTISPPLSESRPVITPNRPDNIIWTLQIHLYLISVRHSGNYTHKLNQNIPLRAGGELMGAARSGYTEYAAATAAQWERPINLARLEFLTLLKTFRNKSRDDRARNRQNFDGFIGLNNAEASCRDGISAELANCMVPVEWSMF